jgi:hypothetical protein
VESWSLRLCRAHSAQAGILLAEVQDGYTIEEEKGDVSIAVQICVLTSDLHILVAGTTMTLPE